MANQHANCPTNYIPTNYCDHLKDNIGLAKHAIKLCSASTNQTLSNQSIILEMHVLEYLEQRQTWYILWLNNLSCPYPYWNFL